MSPWGPSFFGSFALRVAAALCLRLSDLRSLNFLYAASPSLNSSSLSIGWTLIGVLELGRAEVMPSVLMEAVFSGFAPVRVLPGIV